MKQYVHPKVISTYLPLLNLYRFGLNYYIAMGSTDNLYYKQTMEIVTALENLISYFENDKKEYSFIRKNNLPDDQSLIDRVYLDTELAQSLYESTVKGFCARISNYYTEDASQLTATEKQLFLLIKSLEKELYLLKKLKKLLDNYEK